MLSGTCQKGHRSSQNLSHLETTEHPAEKGAEGPQQHPDPQTSLPITQFTQSPGLMGAQRTHRDGKKPRLLPAHLLRAHCGYSSSVQTPSLTAQVSPCSDGAALMSLVCISVNGTVSLLETASSLPSLSPNPGNYQR